MKFWFHALAYYRKRVEDKKSNEEHYSHHEDQKRDEIEKIKQCYLEFIFE